jgi:hypothetical protein
LAERERAKKDSDMARVYAPVSQTVSSMGDKKNVIFTSAVMCGSSDCGKNASTKRTSECSPHIPLERVG